MILLRHQTDPAIRKFFWFGAAKLAFLGGYHAFPGGQFDATDADVPVANAADADTATAISCATRELFEETQVLVARGGGADARAARFVG